MADVILQIGGRVRFNPATFQDQIKREYLLSQGVFIGIFHAIFHFYTRVIFLSSQKQPSQMRKSIRHLDLLVWKVTRSERIKPDIVHQGTKLYVPVIRAYFAIFSVKKVVSKTSISYGF